MQCLSSYLWWYLYSYTKMIFSVHLNGWYVDISWVGLRLSEAFTRSSYPDDQPTTTHNQLFIFHIMLAYQSFQFSILQFWPRLVFHSLFSWLSSIKLAMFFIKNIHLIMLPGLVLIKSSSLKVGLEARAGGILQCEIWYSWLLKAFSLYLQSHIYSIQLQSQKKKLTPINLFPDYVGTHDCFFG